jgi:DNA repair protein RadC
MQTIDNLELRIKKVRVRAPFDSKILEAKDAAVIARKLIGDQAQEHFLVFLVDTRNQIIGYSVAAIGGISSCPIDLRVIFRAAVLTGASGLLVCHSHPSGYVDPSDGDVECTRKINKASDLLGIVFLDHLIISVNGCCSLREMHKELFV